MKHLLNRGLITFILLLGLPALACNLPFGGEDPTAVPAADDAAESNDAADTAVSAPPAPAEDANENTPEPAEATNEPVAEIDSSEDGEDDVLSNLFQDTFNVSESTQRIDELDSYRMSLDFSSTVDDKVQQMQATIISSTKPPASQMTFRFNGFAGPVDLSEINMTRIGETTYTILPELGCITMSEGDILSDSFGQSMDANQFLEDIGDTKLVGEETINGIETLHYTFDESVIKEDEFQFNWAQGDVYVAKDGGYVVRFRLEGEGNVDNLGFALDSPFSGSGEPEIEFIQLAMDLTEINEPVNILVPEACDTSGIADSEFPILEDAFEASSFGGVITYKTQTAFADAVAFYQDSLVAEGWDYLEDDSFVLNDSTALLFFNKDGRSFTVSINQETDTNALLIVIFEEL